MTAWSVPDVTTQETQTGEVLSLLDKIKCIDLDAAKTLEENKFVNDRKIKSLKPEDLHKPFPGQHEKLRPAIMDLINSKTQVDTCLKKLKDSIQPDLLKAALSNNDALDEYLNLLRGMKNQMDLMLSFLNTQITYLEEIRKEKPGESSSKEEKGSDMQTGEVGMTSGPSRPYPPGEPPLPEMEIAQDASTEASPDSWEILPGNGEVGTTSEPYCPNPLGQQQRTQMDAAQDSLPNPEISGACGQLVPQPEQAKRHQKKNKEVESTSWLSRFYPGKQPAPPVMTAQVTYQMVVGGKTFNAHQQLMKKLKKAAPLIEFDESKQNHKITILFCPISTRIGLDVKAAMDEVKDNKPIILVLMHHYPEPRYVVTRETWEDYPNIKLSVNVFYHDSVRGLIKCNQNDDAIHQIKRKFEIYTKNNPETSYVTPLQK